MIRLLELCFLFGCQDTDSESIDSALPNEADADTVVDDAATQDVGMEDANSNDHETAEALWAATLDDSFHLWMPSTVRQDATGCMERAEAVHALSAKRSGPQKAARPR